MNYKKKKFKKISHFLHFFPSAMRNLLICFTILLVVVHCTAQRTPVKKVFRYTKEDSKKLLEQFAEIMDSDEVSKKRKTIILFIYFFQDVTLSFTK